MTDAGEIPLSGTITTSVQINVRQGQPSIAAPVERKLEAGVSLSVLAVVSGQAVQGNNHWYRVGPTSYLWAGGCGPLQAGQSKEAALSGGADAAAPEFADIPRVIDLSHGDGVLSFADAKAAGVVGVIHKATTGATGRDDAYFARRLQATAAGLLWGAYHWGTAAPADLQVKNFLDWSNPDEKTLVALDLESTPGNQMNLSIAREFLTLLQQKIGRRAVIYSGDVLKTYLGGAVDPFFGAHRLWLAQYGAHADVQRSWPTYWLWQYSDGDSGPHPAAIPGIIGDAKKRIDCDRFNGSSQQLAQEWSS